MWALLVTALLPLVRGQQLQLQQELHQLRSTGAPPPPLQLPQPAARSARVLPSVVNVHHPPGAPPSSPHHPSGAPPSSPHHPPGAPPSSPHHPPGAPPSSPHHPPGAPPSSPHHPPVAPPSSPPPALPGQFPRYVEESVDLSTPLKPVDLKTPRQSVDLSKSLQSVDPRTALRPAGLRTPLDSVGLRSPLEPAGLRSPLEPVDLRKPLEPAVLTQGTDGQQWRRPPHQKSRPTEQVFTETAQPEEKLNNFRPTELPEADTRRPSQTGFTAASGPVDHSERPPPASIVERPSSPWLAEEKKPSKSSPHPPTAEDSSLQLYSDAWDLGGHTDSPKKPGDDSLSALEYELAAYNVTLFDAAMDYLLQDATNLSALLPEVTQWKADDANMTRSIAVMNALFTALQARLGDQDSILQRYGLPDTSGFNPRPVRRTWVQGAGQPYRRARPVVHRFRPNVDEHFLGDRAACGSCQFTLMCWMSGGVARGGCGGFMFVCCDHGTRAGKSFNPPPPQVDYGPVRNDPGCGLSDTSRIGITRRIVGGNHAGFGTFPWQAYILIGTSRCGGSLINRQHVITAGHCVARARPGQITITLGDYVLNSNREPLPAYKFKVRAIQVHPRFQFTPQADRYDVAVLTLDRAVPYVPHIQPICLPDKGQEFEGFYGWAAGWGALRPGSRVRPKELQVVDVPVINRHMCERWHRQKGINVIIHEEMMCAGYINGGKDSCQGDSGGPLMIENEGRWYLMGIVSAGYSCAQGKQPGIYHRVSMTSDWISYVAGN